MNAYCVVVIIVEQLASVCPFNKIYSEPFILSRHSQAEDRFWLLFSLLQFNSLENVNFLISFWVETFK